MKIKWSRRRERRKGVGMFFSLGELRTVLIYGSENEGANGWLGIKYWFRSRNIRKGMHSCILRASTTKQYYQHTPPKKCDKETFYLTLWQSGLLVGGEDDGSPFLSASRAPVTSVKKPAKSWCVRVCVQLSLIDSQVWPWFLWMGWIILRKKNL